VLVTETIEGSLVISVKDGGGNGSLGSLQITTTHFLLENKIIKNKNPSLILSGSGALRFVPPAPLCFSPHQRGREAERIEINDLVKSRSKV
jgi:hypothetical protein